jgi:hypothetical protein
VQADQKLRLIRAARPSSEKPDTPPALKASVTRE